METNDEKQSNRKRTGNNAIPTLREKAPITPYKLRDSSKLPSRYREEAPLPTKERRTPNKPKTPVNTNRISFNRAPSSAVRSLTSAENATPLPDDLDIDNLLEPSPVGSKANTPVKTTVGRRKLAMKPTVSSPKSIVKLKNEDSYSKTVGSAIAIDGILDGSRIAELEEADIGLSGDAEEEDRTEMMAKLRSLRGTHKGVENEVIYALNKLKNVLKLPQARRWVICEFFYSGVDEQLLKTENEFSQIFKETFPMLKTRQLNRQEWRAIRRIMGKPRRCSETFFLEERQALEVKRDKVRRIYDGSYIRIPNFDLRDIPPILPRPLVVGMRVYARVRSPKDGVYAGTIDAVLQNGYRVVFEREDLLPPAYIPDYELMFDGNLELVKTQYFIDQNNSKLPFVPQKGSIHSVERMVDVVSYGNQQVVMKKPAVQGANEKVGNFSVRLLVLVVKLSKLLELKKKLVRHLSDLNQEAERANLLTDHYHVTFQEKYAQVVVDLESVNRQLQSYLDGIRQYKEELYPHLSEHIPYCRPDSLRKECIAKAQAMVRRNNVNLNVDHPRALNLITSLTSLLIQIRVLGQQRLYPKDLQSLSEAINEIRSQVSSRNVAAFQDHVEVHMKEIHTLMLNTGALRT